MISIWQKVTVLESIRSDVPESRWLIIMVRVTILYHASWWFTSR